MKRLEAFEELKPATAPIGRSNARILSPCRPKRSGRWPVSGTFAKKLVQGLLLTAAPLAFACGDRGNGSGEAVGTVTVAVDDSTGIQTVESMGFRWAEGEQWRVSAEPVLWIGGIEDRHATLFRVRDAIRLANGTIVVAHASGRELLFMSSSGERVATVEKLGEGPGEFRGISQLIPFSDNEVAAYDSGLQRILLFDSVGVHVNTIPITSGLADRELIGVLNDRGFLFSHHSGFVPSPSDPRPQALTRSLSIVLHAFEGTPVDTLVALTVGNTFSRVGGPWGWIPTPFGTGPEVTVGDGQIFAGHGEEYEIRVYDSQGTLQRIIRNLKPRGEVTTSMIRDHKEQVLGIQSAGLERRSFVEEAMEAVPWPEMLPAFTRIVADQAGCLWVCEGDHVGTDQSCWTVYGSDGGVLGRVDVPSDLRILQIGTDFLFGVLLEEDFPAVVMYGLHRSGIGSPGTS